MLLQATDEHRVHLHEAPRLQLPVLGAARVEHDGAVLVELLHLGAHHVALPEDAAHAELVLLGAAALYVPGQGDGGEHQDALLARPQLDLPALVAHLRHAPHHDVPHLRPVARPQGLHEDELPHAPHDAPHRRPQADPPPPAPPGPAAPAAPAAAVP